MKLFDYKSISVVIPTSLLTEANINEWFPNQLSQGSAMLLFGVKAELLDYLKMAKFPHKRVRRMGRFKKIPLNSKFVARPSSYGNPYVMNKTKDDLAERMKALAVYSTWLDNQLKENPLFLDMLKGFDLACYCPLEKPCHADIILRALYG